MPKKDVNKLADSFPNVVVEQQRNLKLAPKVEGGDVEVVPIMYIAHMGIPGKGVISAGGLTVVEALEELQKLQEKDSIIV